MLWHADFTPRLRPWWHVGVPFLIGAGMMGAIGLASQNRAALLLSLVFVGWGIAWSLRARRGARQHIQLIAAATDLLADPTREHAIWLGPATLLLRPRQHGHLLWTTHGFTWTATEVGSLSDSARRVLLGAVQADLSLAFGDLIDLRHETKVLSGERLVLTCVGGEHYRFGLPEPATVSFVMRALEQR